MDHSLQLPHYTPSEAGGGGGEGKGKDQKCVLLCS